MQIYAVCVIKLTHIVNDVKIRTMSYGYNMRKRQNMRNWSIFFI